MADRGPLARKLTRWIAHPMQAIGAYSVYGIFAILPVDAASALGGWLMRAAGPRLKAARTARRNLERALPGKTAAEIDGILRDMWSNLGRILGEWPHLNSLYLNDFGGRVEISGREYLANARDASAPLIVFTGHHGNWELVGAVCASLGAPLKVIYRPAENRWVNNLILWARRRFTGGLLPKGRDAATGALSLLKAGGNLGVLIDQKLNEGVPVPFFGRDAMTSPVAARLAVGFRCPVLPVRAERTSGARYKVTIYPPMEIPDSGDRKQDRGELLLRMNAMLEGWVREQPAQWFWVHNRWPD